MTFFTRSLALTLAAVLCGCTERVIVSPDPSGAVATFTTAKRFDRNNPFFQSLGTNGRSCATCHAPSDGWSISAAHVRERFAATHGEDPLFASVDGANSPLADETTLAARRAASSLLLERGVIRVGMPIPAGAEFELAAVDDPYGYASAQQLSLFRRPLPATNLRFLTAVMHDGRETFPGHDLRYDLTHQALDATLGHAQAQHAPTQAELDAIVDFELSTTTAQVYDKRAGTLLVEGPHADPFALVNQPFYAGMNDPLGGDPEGAAFDRDVFTLFGGWLDGRKGPGRDARAAIARGERIFNEREFTITGVGGLNGELVGPSLRASCSVCHDVPNVGGHSLAVPLDIGIAHPSRRSPEVPLYTLRNLATGELLQTLDPGRALVTGRWKDVGRFKGPNLRGLAAHAPYFHDGSAATLEDVVEFYDGRFTIQLTPREKADLVAFLKAL